jgi:hypothetical protein
VDEVAEGVGRLGSVTGPTLIVGFGPCVVVGATGEPATGGGGSVDVIGTQPTVDARTRPVVRPSTVRRRFRVVPGAGLVGVVMNEP